MKILGIETSCDETSAALLDGGRVVCNITHTQEEHARYGGVVPEIASRAHLEKIGVLARRALCENALAPNDLDLVAVTDRPGLAGALLVGVSFALGMHAAHNVPITGVNHLDGHIASLFIGRENLQLPILALVASGGHTAIYYCRAFGEYENLGRTVDDAAGEAFDKVGKMLGFSYPAGRAVELEAAKFSGVNDLVFPIAKVARPQQTETARSQQFMYSFSGLKTAVKTFLAKAGEDYINNNRAKICNAFQSAVVGSLANNLEAAARSLGVKTVAAAGGVACNGFLRNELVKRFGADNVIFPPPELCTDNGAMIAMAGHIMRRNNALRFPITRSVSQ